MKKLFYTFILFISLFIFITNVYASTTYRQGIIKTSTYIRTGAYSSASIAKSDTGFSMSLGLPESVEIIGESGSYYQIKFFYSGFIYTGYIPKSSVTATTYVSDENYEKSLRDMGFPADYASRLAILKAIHPNWAFTPSFTGNTPGGLDFNTVVNGEASVVARNLINSSNTSLRSTADGAYQNGQWISLSGSGWYAASTQTIGFYMDSRNFLEEGHIFMFENLGYNAATQSSNAVSKVIGSSFMKNPFECFANANSCNVGTHYYTDTFMKSGADKGVSPVHLASRVIQEQGSNGSTLSLGKGYNGDYIGFYNFFNINASGTTTEKVITNGLQYAYNRNWNNQYISIYDGSNLIASNFVKRGQSNLYYQKFNTIVPSYYGNQYMQNVRAPYTESYSTYVGYYKAYSSQEEWNNAVYEFLIPVYSNMPSYTTLDTSGNADATLSSLSVTSCSLNPSFQSSAYNYDCYIGTDTSSVTIDGEATNPLAKVANLGTINLTNNDTTATVIVTAANGNAATYTINIHKIETDGYNPTEIMNGIGIKVTGAFLSNIAVGSDISNILNSITNKYHFASVQMYNSAGAGKSSGVVQTGDRITVSNAGSQTTFTVTIYGDTSGDGSIDIRDLLVIQKHLVKSKTLTNEYLKASDINKDGTVDIRDLLLEQKSLLGAYSISQG